jgi:peptidoglycan/xylan/chitin deacetylase (PgdA/CDA1 family)
VKESGIWDRVKGKYLRTGARFLYRRPFEIDHRGPIISFTFDDFPQSALRTGGDILKRYEARGTYYTSIGLMGKEEPTGTMFTRDDLERALSDGHELGCHTFGHFDAAKTGSELFEQSIEQNQQAIGELCSGAVFRTLSYPIGVPRARTKQKAGQHYVCCRGGGQTFNGDGADLNYLYSFFLEQSRDDFQTIRNVVEENRLAQGWLIFSTHDISDTPTHWGCTPSFFEEVVRLSAESGARIMPVVEAWKALSVASQS